MTTKLVIKDAEYWAEWLIDAIACVTQDRRFLLDDPKCDEELCAVIVANAKKAIELALKEAEKSHD